MRETKPEFWPRVPASLPPCPEAPPAEDAWEEPALDPADAAVVEVASPGGSSEAADGVTGPLEPGSPA